MPSLLQDLRYTLRTYRRDAGFAAFAIAIVGLGIGASSTVFSVVNTLLLRPLPFSEPERLVWIANHDTSGLSGQTTQVGSFGSHGCGPQFGSVIGSHGSPQFGSPG